MADNCKGYAGEVPVYCAYDKMVPVADVKPNPKNPNQHPEKQIEMLAKIITTQGWRAPVTVSTLSGLVVRGHGRLMAAKFAGLEFVPVDLQHYDSMDEELADLLADNKIAELAEIDNKLLADVFADIDLDAIDIDITGYTKDEYNSIVSALTDEMQEQELKDPDAKVAPPKIPTTRIGDVWRIGRHRLMCGDSTNAETVALLMDSKKADLVFTDPPYGIAVVQNNQVGGDGATHFNGNVGAVVQSSDYMPIKGDETTDTARLNYEIVKELSKNQIIFGGNYFTDFLPPKACWCIWDKENTGNFADVEMAWTSFDKGAKLYKWLWNGLCRKGQRRIEGKSRVHPTQKPVGLIAEILKDFTKENNIILDCFGGSGSTLIASEQIGRICYMMEFEPHYVDVIVRRYIQVTGKTDVVLLRDGNEIPVADTGILND